MSQLQLMLLGTPIVKHGEETLTFSTRKALALLTYLAVQGGMHLRKTLSEAFWPELDAEHGRAALRASLMELRDLFERPHSPGERNHLLIERERLAIDQCNPLILDLGVLEPLSTQTGEALADQERGVLLAQLEQASRRVRGPFLAGSPCAIRNSSTIGRANNESTGTCTSSSYLRPCPTSMKKRGRES
jgi:DNA-binding SARP family transcriptional activator